MPEYRRAFQPGGMFFFTVVTHHRYPMFADPQACTFLGNTIRAVQRQRPFEMVAIVLLPEHLHCMWQLPVDDTDFSTRWACIKKDFSRQWVNAGGSQGHVSCSRHRRRGLGIWQERFWEHTIRDEPDMIKHIEYIHYNPVKHERANCPHAWPYSSFHRYVREDLHEPDWGCTCGGRHFPIPDFTAIEKSIAE